MAQMIRKLIEQIRFRITLYTDPPKAGSYPAHNNSGRSPMTEG